MEEAFTANSSKDIFAAVEKNDIKKVQSLLKNGASVNVWSSHGQSLLHISVYKGFEKMVDVLLDNGAHIDAKNKGGKTPLALAAFNNRIGVDSFYAMTR